jgi:hypothetical protein
MYIYTPNEDPVFESLKTVHFNEADLPPWESSYVKEMHPMYGVKRPDLSERNRLNSGDNHRASKEGYVHNRLGSTASDETRAKMSGPRPNFQGENHPNYGKPLSDDLRKKLAEANKGREPWNRGVSSSEGTKRLLKEKRKGKVWWNNGERCTMAVNSPGAEWVRGRL